MASGSSKNTDDDISVPMMISDCFHSDNSSKEWREKVPVGLRFNPTDEELVGHYLARKVNGLDAGPLSSYIKEVPVYDFDPWQLRSFSSDFGGGIMYFFNKIMKKHLKGETKARIVTKGGGGWWSMTEPSSPVNDRYGKQIGIKKSLAYLWEDKKSGREMLTPWRMNEYRLLNPGITKSDAWEWALNVVYSSDCYDSIPDMVGSGSSSSATPANLDFPRYKQIDDITALHYLSERAAGLINQHIKQLNVYDFVPGNLSGFAFDSGSGVKCMCFFTPIKTEQKLPKAFNRIASGGCWKKTGKTFDIIGNDGKPYGIKTSLAYYKIQSSRKQIKTQWLMKEYIYLGHQSNQTDTWTLCVIYFHDNKGKQCDSESGFSGDSRTKRKHCESTVSAENPDLQGKRHSHDQNLGINTSNNVGTLQQGLPIPNPGQFMSNPVMGPCGASVSNVPVLNQSPFLQAPPVEPCSNFVPDDQLFYTGHQPQPEQYVTAISADSRNQNTNQVQFSGDHQPQQHLRENPCSAVATVSTTTASVSNVPVLNQSPFLQAPPVEPCSNFVPDDQLFYTGHQPQPEQYGTGVSADSWNQNTNQVQFSGDHQPQQHLRENPCSAVATVSTTTDLLEQFIDPDHYFDSITNLDGDENWDSINAECSPIRNWDHNL